MEELEINQNNIKELKLDVERCIAGYTILNFGQIQVYKKYLHKVKLEWFGDKLCKALIKLTIDGIENGKMPTQEDYRFCATTNCTKDIGEFSLIYARAGGLIEANCYLKSLEEFYLRDRYIELLQKTLMNFDPNIEIKEQILKFKKTIGELETVDSENIVHQIHLVKKEVDNIRKKINSKTPEKVYETGFNSLDDILFGLEPAQLTIIAGRPSMGKTMLAKNLIYNIAKKGIITMFFSMEERGVDFARNLISIDENMNTTVLKKGFLNEESLNTILENQTNLNLPILVNDTSKMTVQDICNQIREMVRRAKVQVFFIDHLSWIVPDMKKYRNKNDAIGEITSELAAIARELDVSIVLLCQLSRAVESRDSKIPQLSDLRDSGNIEQDADKIITVFREAYYVERQGNKQSNTYEKDSMDLNIIKHRGGKVGNVRLYVNLKKGIIRDGLYGK